MMLSDAQSFDFGADAGPSFGDHKAPEDLASAMPDQNKNHIYDLAANTGIDTIPESTEHEGGEDGTGLNENMSNHSSEQDYEKAFQDYKVTCKLSKLVYNFGLSKKVDGHPAPLGSDKYSVQAVHQILRTDTKLKSRRQETKNLETQIKEKMVLGVKLDFLKDKKQTGESTGADEDGSPAGVSAESLGNMTSLNPSSSSRASSPAIDEGLS